MLEYQLGFFIFSMQDSVERSVTKWLKQVIATKDDFARETGQEAVAPPEFPADGRALLHNIIFIVHVADDKGMALTAYSRTCPWSWSWSRTHPNTLGLCLEFIYL